MKKKKETAKSPTKKPADHDSYSICHDACSSILGEIAGDVYRLFTEDGSGKPSRKDFGAAMAEMSIEQALFRCSGIEKVYDALTNKQVKELEKELAKESLYYLNY